VSLQLDQVVPWGRSLWEYVHMFDLDESALSSSILGVGDGPASFNAEMHDRGRGRRRRVVSVDPIYLFGAEQSRLRVRATHDRLVAAAREHHGLFNWHHLHSPEHMGRVRIAAMERFLRDFDSGRRQGRYVAGELPSLPFADAAFDLALCSHLLFLYSAQLSLDFYVHSLIEMARVARQVRVFPLLMLGNTPSPHVAGVREKLAGHGLASEVRAVPYEFQKGGNQMLVVSGPGVTVAA